MEGLKKPLVYALADSLGMELYVDKLTGTVTGETSRDVNMDGLRLSVPMTVVSSELRDNEYMLLVKVFGNMGLFVVAYKAGSKEVVDLHVLNIAKTDKLSGYMEKLRPLSKISVVQGLQAGIIRSYIKTTKDRWELVA